MFILIALLSWSHIMQTGDDRLLAALYNDTFPLPPQFKIRGFNVSEEVHDLSLTSVECLYL